VTGKQSLALAVIAICLGGVSGFFVAHRSPRGAAVPLIAKPAVLQQDDRPAEPAPEHPPIPQMLPPLSLPDAQGKLHALSEWRGHSLLINFWATWCEPCRREIPLLKALLEQRSSQGLQIIGIAVDFKDAVQTYAHEKGIHYPVLIGEEQGLAAISAFGMEPVFPFTVFVDRQGRVVTLKVGELHADEAQLILDRMRDVDLGRLELAAARHAIGDGIAQLAARRALSQAPGTDPPRR
jgi:peroxiredoxin